MFRQDAPDLDRYVTDLAADPLIRRISDLFVVWVVLGLLIPTVLGGVLTGSWMGALIGFLWGGLARIFLVHHTTWSINSACHIWGAKPYRSHDESRNNILFGLLGMGEGWHNNHHAFPTSARHGLAWWQLDCTWLIIRMLKFFRLAWRVRLPTPEAIAAKDHSLHEPTCTAGAA
jgi:stearoyl-CoA desaturase (delta-9 desaturase)